MEWHVQSPKKMEKTSVRINTKKVNYKKNDREIINVLSDEEQKDNISDV
jgi:hypothetical protein